jgi:hypothetical protein
MAEHWFYGQNGERLGPWSSEQLKDLAAAGTIQPTDTIWKEGIERGALAKNVKNLFSPASPKPLGQTEGPTGAVVPVATHEQSLAPPAVAVEKASAEPPPSILAPSHSGESDVITAQGGSKPKTIGSPKRHIQQLRAVALRGAIIFSQDGRVVRFKKKCPKCGHEDPSRGTLPIRPGMTRASFFCRKCRKSRQVEIQGIGERVSGQDGAAGD